MISLKTTTKHVISKNNKFGENEVFLFSNLEELYLFESENIPYAYELEVTERINEDQCEIRSYANGISNPKKIVELSSVNFYELKNDAKEYRIRTQNLESVINTFRRESNINIPTVKVIERKELRKYGQKKIYEIYVDGQLQEEIEGNKEDIYKIAKERYLTFEEIPLQVGERGSFEVFINNELIERFNDSYSAYTYVYELKKTESITSHILLKKIIYGGYGDGEYLKRNEE